MPRLGAFCYRLAVRVLYPASFIELAMYHYKGNAYYAIREILRLVREKRRVFIYKDGVLAAFSVFYYRKYKYRKLFSTCLRKATVVISFLFVPVFVITYAFSLKGEFWLFQNFV